MRNSVSIPPHGVPKGIAWATFVLTLLSVAACIGKGAPEMLSYPAGHEAYRYVGRTGIDSSGAYDLMGSAAYVEFEYTGDSVSLEVATAGGPNGYSFATVEVDGEYLGRFKIPTDTVTSLGFATGSSTPGPHRLRLSQASEPWVGHLLFYAAAAKTITRAPDREATVTFFGDSISAGAGSDTTGVGCDEAHYGDQANAFLAFPARAGRLLNVDYVVHAQSGRGLYVNWNAEDPPLPALLDHLSMDTTDTRTYDLTAEDPIAAVVCLGTNDMNGGEARADTPFDSTHFEQVYVGFVDRLVAAYPRAAIVLVTTPLSGPPQAAVLERILARVKQHANEAHPNVRVGIANVTGYPVSGCSRVPHPNITDQALIAETVAAVVREVTGASFAR